MALFTILINIIILWILSKKCSFYFRTFSTETCKFNFLILLLIFIMIIFWIIFLLKNLKIVIKSTIKFKFCTFFYFISIFKLCWCFILLLIENTRILIFTLSLFFLMEGNFSNLFIIVVVVVLTKIYWYHRSTILGLVLVIFSGGIGILILNRFLWS